MYEDDMSPFLQRCYHIIFWAQIASQRRWSNSHLQPLIRCKSEFPVDYQEGNCLVGMARHKLKEYTVTGVFLTGKI
jgi:hypothetical protein